MTKNESAARAVVFHIARGSLHDGPGLRTVVYVKGCPLRCRWCHNPEGISPQPEILYRPSRCIGCGRCAALCSEGHPADGGSVRYERSACAGCLRCAQVCPNEALAVCGVSTTPEEAFNEARRDADYYRATGGGVTLSGGEPLTQPDFAASFLGLCRKNGIRTAVESSLHAGFEAVEAVACAADLLIADIKLADSGRHRRHTGAGNELILSNISRIAGIHPNIMIRVPLIPGVNDDGENLKRTAGIVREIGGGIRGIELLRYNPLGAGKYEAAGLRGETFAHNPQSDETMAEKRDVMRPFAGDIPVFFT